MLLKSIMAFLLSIPAANALILEDMQSSKTLETQLTNKTIAYYIGSFDPLHRGHESVARTVIEKGYADFVLIYPAWGGDAYKDRTDIKTRLDQLFSVFRDDPRVIVTRLCPKELQMLLTEPDETRTVRGKPTVHVKIPGLEILGVIGSDVALSMVGDERKRSVFMEGVQVGKAHAATTIGGIMALPVKGFILSKRVGDDVSPLNGFVGERSIVHEITGIGADLSSTQIRVALREKKPVDTMIHPHVYDIICEQGLYGTKMED